METPSSPPSIQDLLAQTDWVRALVRHLVVDEHRADDVAQQTMLQAIEKPPEDHRRLRVWLVRVARRFARRTCDG